ncbi:MAG TPA: cobaltochelatase subunit CobN [Geminicoccus sp.]|uniref:cobaltochelatase subunit CobN n=1 Tax=Geminicoccus sp. TaxID=2024832 RepID=UPI002E327D11|nr:cobaltochelatase subunit CobN [Geminicoccus sp.]HEX2527635.1 cobaltochelatase subunit CobN [Geminicoccus sp.]
MHLLPATASGTPTDGEAVDLAQTPADLVVASFADTELACLAAAAERLSDRCPSLRIAPLRLLRHPMSVDLWVERTVAHARLVVLRLIGGRPYWSYGLDQVVAACRGRNIPLAVLPGDDRADPSLDGLSSLPAAINGLLWRQLAEGGIENALSFLESAAAILDGRPVSARPSPLPRTGLYRDGRTWPTPDAFLDGHRRAPDAILLFYRALMLAGDTAPVDELINALRNRGIEAVGLFTTSLKDPAEGAIVRSFCAELRPFIVLAATSFSTARAEDGWATPLDELDVPVLQLVLAGSTEQAWRQSSRGLMPVDLGMQVALPELDGRLHGPVIGFKDEGRIDQRTQCPLMRWLPFAEGIQAAAERAQAWLDLQRTPAPERRIALVLANYPIRDGRIANGVGLDTPASTVVLLRALAEAGYDIQPMPADGDDLVRQLQAGVTNEPPSSRTVRTVLPLDRYERWLDQLSPAIRAAVRERWGSPCDDPFCVDGQFLLPVLPLGNTIVALQPSRGYEIDPALSWHDPALPPPHRYVAFYLWLRHEFGAHALVQVGKHGNLEWLPGKATGLSQDCFPAALIGPLPVIYPFIVNDPGEGTQAKRRTGAVVVDHLTPPLARGGLHGDLRALENLLDEYSEARDLDPKRAKALGRSIAEEAQRLKLDHDLASAGSAEDSIVALDSYLCDLKELQIRDGLHVLGTSPTGHARAEMLSAIIRLPRGSRDGDASLPRALAADLDLHDFDPLAGEELGRPWLGPKPPALDALSRAPWRTLGDTIERLEHLALAMLADKAPVPPAWQRTRAVLDQVVSQIAPALDHSGRNEITSVLHALDGRFIRPGPSGAPSRGRPDVLPTGRNFFSIDARSLPTPTAWRLGWASAASVVQLYVERHGDWPKALVISAWGTANMRTGGDDIAQALALMGCRPVWDGAGGRVTGIEVLPLSMLDRPRIDVTFRVSGFFRDAFPHQIALLDEAVRLVSALDEPPECNPLADRVRTETARLVAAGQEPSQAQLQASARIFGSRPGAYGAGLQALIDERHWQTDADLAAAYLTWGGYAYGRGRDGINDRDQLEQRLAGIDLVLHNQDNREHDLLDSDDYYQFEGGVIAAVRTLSGRQPEAFHVDHSRPETPKPRTLAAEIGRIVRGRASNPRWIAGVMRHGYKGAFEMAATVDYLFAFAATARVVEDHHFDQLFEAYLQDEQVRSFLEEASPAGLREMAARFMEAVERGLWRPARNSVVSQLTDLLAQTPQAR